MSGRRFVPVFLLIAVARAADPLPTMEELQKSLDGKDFAAVLAGSTRVLQLRGPATASFHRSAVWSLKGEALVNSSQFTPAAVAFTSAAQEKDATDDERDLALSTAMLMKRSDRKGYQPPTSRERPAPPRYDVLDPAKRKDALAALLDVEAGALSPRIEKLKSNLVADPALLLLKNIADLRPLDRTVNGSTAKLDALEKQIAANYVARIKDWADASHKRLDTLQTSSQVTMTTRSTDSKGIVHLRTALRGLTSQEQTEIRDLLSTSKNHAAAEQQIAAAMGPSAKDVITPSQSSIQGVFDQGQSVLQAAIVNR